MVISIMATLAEQERINISERTKAGLRKAKMQGKKLGAPEIAVDMATVRERRAAGHSLRAIATDLGVSPSLLVKKENLLKKGEQNAQTR